MMGKGDRKVIIIGAGLTGLRIGQILASAGMQIELIETQPTVGGMLQTVERSYMGDCYMFDLGPHLFFEEYASVYESLLGNGSDDQLTVVKGHFVIKVGDETLLYPLKMMNMLARLPLSLTQRII
ncbi:MAG: Amino oxidase protein, partial [Thermodesulfobacteriota bacterium]|nr:Amino oxidase protein [Thermodesulfobacteriota bacterium]